MGKRDTEDEELDPRDVICVDPIVAEDRFAAADRRTNEIWQEMHDEEFVEEDEEE